MDLGVSVQALIKISITLPLSYVKKDGEWIMEEIQIVNFQNNVYDIINSVINSHQPVLISDKRKLLVKIVPISYPEQESWLGCMRGTGNITGDVISPAEDTGVWEVFSE